MKKMIATALCLTVVSPAFAQKVNVDNAKKLSGKFDKIEEARSLIRQAIEDPSTANDANTYYIAGKIEFDAYDKGLQAGMVNPDDPSANPAAMSQELLNGYEMFLKALPLDQIPNEKGEIKPRVTKDIVNKVAGHTNDFFNAGAQMYEMQKYYPESYQAFIIYADMPDQEFLGSKAPKLDEANRAQAYFNAALAAWSGSEIYKSADAFRAARMHGYDDPNCYIYEIACWQASMQRDTTMNETAQKRIFEVAQAGNQKYGMSQPVFLNNLVNAYVMADDFDSALSTVNDLLQANPDNANLYGLRAYIYDRSDNDEASLADYRKAASLPDADFETLRNAAKKMYRAGVEKGNNPELENNPEAKKAIKTDYFDPGLDMARRAKALNGSDSDIDNVIDAIEYVISVNYK